MGCPDFPGGSGIGYAIGLPSSVGGSKRDVVVVGSYKGGGGEEEAGCIPNLTHSFFLSFLFKPFQSRLDYMSCQGQKNFD